MGDAEYPQCSGKWPIAAALISGSAVVAVVDPQVCWPARELATRPLPRRP
jgi:hypothetical protein